jgi:hypothetical protein
VETDLDSISQSLPYCDSDSTLREVYGIDSKYMKKAALYARVSGDLQAKEGHHRESGAGIKKADRRSRSRVSQGIH